MALSGIGFLALHADPRETPELLKSFGKLDGQIVWFELPGRDGATRTGGQLQPGPRPGAYTRNRLHHNLQAVFGDAHAQELATSDRTGRHLAADWSKAPVIAGNHILRQRHHRRPSRPAPASSSAMPRALEIVQGNRISRQRSSGRRIRQRGASTGLRSGVYVRLASVLASPAASLTATAERPALRLRRQPHRPAGGPRGHRATRSARSLASATT
jgi:hypothetical protein